MRLSFFGHQSLAFMPHSWGFLLADTKGMLAYVGEPASNAMS